MTKRRIRIGLLDGIILAGVVLAACYLFFKVRTGMAYHWNWSVIPQYLFRYDADRERWVANLLMEGFFTTLRLSVWVMILGTLLGTIMGLLRVAPGLFGRFVATTYVELLRNMPPLVLVFIFYFFIGDRIFTALGTDEFIRSVSEGTGEIVGFLFAPRPGSPPSFPESSPSFSTKGPTSPKSSGEGLSRSRRGSRRPLTPSGFPGAKKCATSSCPRPFREFSRLLPVSLFPSSRTRPSCPSYPSRN